MKKAIIARENIDGFKLPFYNLEMYGVEFDYYDIQFNDDDSIDKYFSEILSEIVHDKPELIFIPSWLGQPMHYLGVRLAMHVRLSGINEIKDIPIVLLGAETELEFHKNCLLSRFLNSDMVFYTCFSSEKIREFLEQFDWAKNDYNKFDLSENLKYFDLTPPANYQSHHSIDNELALLRWAEYLNCDYRIPEVKENLQTGLYFKYHRALNPINTSDIGNPNSIIGNGNVLLIDDEADKGWKDFYDCFFQHNIRNKSIQFEALKADFKSLSQRDIIEVARNKVNKFNADLVLLDLRLCDSDFAANSEANELTGYKILEEIKKINRGIHVIITTASNKVWNYQSTINLGANGYIIKKGDSNVEEDIRSLKNKVDEALNRAPFLKKVHTLISDIKFHIQNHDLFDSDQEDSLRKSLIVNYDVSFELLEKAFLNAKYFNYCYLQLFLCIEEFLRIKAIFEYGDKCYVNLNMKIAERRDKVWQSAIKYVGRNQNIPSHYIFEEDKENSKLNPSSVDFKMSSVLIFFFNQENSNCHKWPNIRDVRNKKAAHPETSIVTNNEILVILRFQEYIFNKENLQIPSRDGLSDSITENDIHKLKEKLGGKE